MFVSWRSNRFLAGPCRASGGARNILRRARQGLFKKCDLLSNMAFRHHFGRNLAMSTGRHSFKHKDAARLIRAVEAAGKTITGVTLKDGAVTVAVDAAQPAIDNTNANSWDEVLSNAPNRFAVSSACSLSSRGIPA